MADWMRRTGGVGARVGGVFLGSAMLGTALLGVAKRSGVLAIPLWVVATPVAVAALLCVVAWVWLALFPRRSGAAPRGRTGRDQGDRPPFL